MGTLLRRLSLFSAATMYALGGAPGLEAGEDVKIFTWMNLDVTFDTGEWQLSLGINEGTTAGWPLISFSGLYATKGEKTIKISSPKDMKKLPGLSIRSEKAALDFVRLFTREDEDVYSVFTSPRAVERDSKHASVVREGSSYVVKRKLAYVDEGGSDRYPLYEVEERITSDGTYTINRKRLVRRLWWWEKPAFIE